MNSLEMQMNGALLNAVSRIAIAAAAGLAWSVNSALAADLGGNCCADLEERIAELEATTARKGNRKMSLTVSGQVTRSILYWNDGDHHDTYAGLDNHNQSTRFVFSGTAKITPKLMAGFEFMTEIGFGGRTSAVNQGSPDGSVGLGGFANGTTAFSSDPALAVRTANWFLEDSTLGRVTVGRINFGGPVGTIDLGGISTVAHFSPNLVGGSFMFKTNTGAFSGVTMASIIGPTYGGDRIEGIRYDTPSIGGFLGQLAWGEDDVASASLRYAGDFSGFRLAAGIGWQKQQKGQLDGGFSFLGATNAPNNTLGYTSDASRNRSSEEWGGSVALMHVASGLFVQGEYEKSKFGTEVGLTGNDAHIWEIQGGISKNWFGLGNTSPYVEYGRASGFAGATIPDADSDVKFWGIGIVQQIDAAAMELYLGWRHFEADRSGATVVGTSSAQPVINGKYQDLDIVNAGARIRF
jgi:Gram-negative porin